MTLASAKLFSRAIAVSRGQPSCVGEVTSDHRCPPPVTRHARSFDILVALVPHQNDVVSKRDLMAQVWPEVVVEENSLRVQTATPRKALGEGNGGARYIATLAGRGSYFAAPGSA